MNYAEAKQIPYEHVVEIPDHDPPLYVTLFHTGIRDVRAAVFIGTPGAPVRSIGSVSFYPYGHQTWSAGWYWHKDHTNGTIEHAAMAEFYYWLKEQIYGR